MLESGMISVANGNVMVPFTGAAYLVVAAWEP